MEKTSVVIVADVRIYEEQLRQCLAEREDCLILGSASTLNEAVLSVEQHRPDVVLLDMAMVDALSVLRAVAELQLAKVVALAIEDSEQDVVACAEAGMAGYVTREASVDSLARTLRSVRRGELVCSPAVASILLRQVRAQTRWPSGRR